MMVDDMCVFSCFFHPAIILNIRHHWAPKMTKFNTKPGSSRRCSIFGQRDYDSNNAKQGNQDPIDQTFHHSSWLNHDSIMTTWLLDFTILSQLTYLTCSAQMCQPLGPWERSSVPLLLSLHERRVSNVSNVDRFHGWIQWIQHIGRMGNPPGAAEHLLFHHLVLQKIFDGYPIITTWDRSGTGDDRSPEFWHPIYLWGPQFSSKYHEHSWT